MTRMKETINKMRQLIEISKRMTHLEKNLLYPESSHKIESNAESSHDVFSPEFFMKEVFPHIMDASKNSGTPKWMVYKGKPY